MEVSLIGFPADNEKNNVNSEDMMNLMSYCSLVMFMLTNLYC